jgi:hypothetical protein
MKKSLLIFMSMFVLSCSSDSDNKNDSTLLGEWKYTSSNTYGVENQLTNCEKQLGYIEFKSSNVVIEKIAVNSGTAINEKCMQDIYDGEYLTNDSDKEIILSFYKDGKLIKRKNYFIVELSNTFLKIKLFKNGYSTVDGWKQEDLPEIKRTVYTYSK